MKKIKSVLEAVVPVLESKRQPRKVRLLRKLLEMGEADMGAAPEMEPPAEDVAKSPEDHIKEGICAACNAIIDDDQMSADEKIAKLRDYLKAHEKLTGEPEKDLEEGEEKMPSEEGKKKEEEDKDKPKMESLAAEVAELKREKKARELCESAGVVIAGDDGKVLLEALMASRDDAALRRLVDREKKLQSGSRRHGAGAPRSQEPGSGRQLTESRTPKTADELLALIS